MWSSWTTSAATRDQQSGAPSKRPAPTCSTFHPIVPTSTPIENAFAKRKALLRKAAVRTIGALRDQIGMSLNLFTPDKCANYFKAAGYGPD